MLRHVVFLEVARLECGKREYSLQNGRHVAAVAQVCEAGEAFSEYWLQCLPIVTGQREVVLEVLFNLQFGHALFCLAQRLHTDSEMCEMVDQIRVFFCIVAYVAVDI